MRLADAQRALQDPEPDARPQMRWWWFGPDIGEDDVDRQLTAMHDAGIGGVEVAFEYPLRPGSPEYLSDEALRVLRHAAQQARAKGLRFHVTMGSGWSYGGTHIAPEHAAMGLMWERRALATGAHDLRIPLADHEHLVAAALMQGDLTEPLRDLRPLPVQTSGTASASVAIPDGRGPRVLLVGIARPTGQIVKRAAAGADGPVLDHYSKAATRSHLEHVGGRILGAVPADLIESLFCDSLEAYAANWTPSLPDEFEQRRGYSFDGQLHLLALDTTTTHTTADFRPAEREAAHRLKADVTRSLSELYEENFVAECRSWCHERGVLFRIQGYGVPPARVGSYRFADRYEGEGWGWKTLTATRWASSAAHLLGEPIVSCETWTWIHSPSFRATPLDLRGEAHEHFLNGVNELLGHGWPHSPADPADRDAAGADVGAPGAGSGADADAAGTPASPRTDPDLGWFLYAAGVLDDRNPWWPAMPALMRDLQRLSSVLRLGRPHRDVLLFAPYDDAAQTLGQDPHDFQTFDLYKATRDVIPESVIAAIRSGGRDYDLIDDTLLDTVDPATAPLVVIAGATGVADAMAEWLERVVAAGGTVLTVVSTATTAASTAGLPGTPGTPTTLDDLAAALEQHSSVPLGGPAAPHPDLGVVRRDGETTDIAVAINTGPTELPFEWVPRGGRQRVELWSPDTGRRIATGILHPYEAIIVVETDEPEQTPAPEAAAEAETERPLTDWTLTWPGEQPQRVELPHVWEDDPARLHHSGAASYETAFALDGALRGAGRILLDLGTPSYRAPGPDARHQSYRADVAGPVGEIAVVEVNGREAGVLWAPPYRLDVTDLVREGENTLRITVHNTAANALAVDRNPARRAAAVQEVYGWRFAFQDLDRALDDVRSGLDGPVRLLLLP